MSKALDKLWHEGLLFQLKTYGIQGNVLSLLNDFLSERQQPVLLNGKCSAWRSITAGVPQGSLLGPLKFLIYINDLPASIHTTPYIFVDDVSLFHPIQNLSASTETLNNDLSMNNNRSYQRKMLFNPDANKQATDVYFTNKKAVGKIPQFTFNGSAVKSVNSHKHLILDGKLTFENHLNDKIVKANKGVGVIKALFYTHPLSDHISIIVTYTINLPVMNYRF